MELNEDLLFAAANGDLERVEKLIDAGADIHFFDEMSKSALHYAVEGAHRQLVHWLIEKGANVNAHLRDNAGDTPMTIAAYQGHFEISKLLLQAGADPYITAWMGKDALDYAINRKDANGEKIKVLIVNMHPPDKKRRYRLRNHL